MMDGVSLELVPLSRIRANENNPRTRFGGLDELAEEFADNPVNPNEPWNPVMVYRDANVFRLVDGERRWRAMRKAGKVSECHAYVFDTMEAAVAVLAMLDTDSKQALTDEEFGWGLQTALILGVPEEKVEARFGDFCAPALRRQVERAGGKAVQMSVEQMLAADEFADDPEVYGRIVDAKDRGEWLAVRNNARRRREEAADRVAAEQAASAASAASGLEVCDKPPKGALLERSLYGSAADAIARDGAE